MRDVYKTLLDESEDFVGFDLKYVKLFSHAASVELIFFNFARKRFTETENQTVLRKILVETKALDDSIHLSQIKGKHTNVVSQKNALLYLYVYTSTSAAARRFFQSKQEDLNLREKGKYESKVINQRRRNRIHKVSTVPTSRIVLTLYSYTQKLESRKAALARTNALTEEKKTTWRKILIPSFMSSE